LSFLTVRGALAFGHRKDVRAKIGQSVKQALDAVKASPAQRNQIQAAIDQVARTAEEAFGGAQGMPDFDELLDAFSRSRLDPRAIDALKLKRETRQKKLADALTQAFYDVHDALTRDQRSQLTDYARGRVEGRHMHAFKQKLIDGFVNATVEDLLEQLAADEHERQVVHGARDEVLAAIHAAQDTKQASLDQLTALFRGDALDRAGVARFRAEKEAQVRAIADAVEHALTQVHDGLSADHRTKLVELMRARRERARHAPSSPDEGF
jgi:hypothetical protein